MQLPQIALLDNLDHCVLPTPLSCVGKTPLTDGLGHPFYEHFLTVVVIVPKESMYTSRAAAVTTFKVALRGIEWLFKRKSVFDATIG